MSTCEKDDGELLRALHLVSPKVVVSRRTGHGITARVSMLRVKMQNISPITEMLPAALP